MNNLASALKNEYSADLSKSFVRRACYYSKVDCIEYVSKNVLAVSDRIDGTLTILWDENLTEIIGFKIKGFRCIYDTNIKPLITETTDCDFNQLIINALENFFTKVGDEFFAQKDKRAEAYKNVINFIKQEPITIEPSDLQEIKEAA